MSNTKPTPRDLDPNFVDVETPEVSTAKEPSPEEPMTVHRVPFVDANGVQRVAEYGPMPTSEFLTWLPRFERGEVTE